ncbi:MAG: hypothetical protein ACTHNU_15950 [Gaiellales bacterium]
MQQGTGDTPPAGTESVDRVAVLVAAIVLAAAAGLLLLRGTPSPRPAPPPRAAASTAIPAPLHGLLEIDSRTHQVVSPQTYRGLVPGAAQGFGDRWVPNLAGVTRVGGGSESLIPLPGGARSVVVAGDSVWATSRTDQALLYRLDPRRLRITSRIRASDKPSGRLFSGVGWVWEPCRTFIAQIDPTSGRIAARIPVQPEQAGHNSSVIAFGAGSMWVIDEHSTELDLAHPGVLYRIDPATHSIMAKIPMPALNWYDEFELAWAGGRLWVTDDHQGILRAVSPQTDAVTETRLFGVIDSLAAGNGSVWLLDHSRRLTQLGYDGRPEWRGSLPGRPRSIGLDGGWLWVSYVSGA